jgi:hypothetical protein
MTPGHISGKEWCPVCMGHCPTNARIKFEKEVESRGGKILGVYVDTATKVEIICVKGHKYYAKPNNVMNGKYCRSCGLSESKGERAVRLYLEKTEVQHEKEKSFEWMPYKKYDFYIECGELNYLIEFDGIQHFEFSSFFHGDEITFSKRRKTDIEKTAAALNNNFLLLRISHKDIDNIEEIIDQFLNNPQNRLTLSSINDYSWLVKDIQPLLCY